MPVPAGAGMVVGRVHLGQKRGAPEAGNRAGRTGEAGVRARSFFPPWTFFWFFSFRKEKNGKEKTRRVPFGSPFTG